MADSRNTDGYQHYPSDDPSANLWTTYLSMSEKYDQAMVQNWKGDMDAILIFAGLFSASVTAFIIESYRSLNPDPANTSVVILAQISQQLASIVNASSANPSPFLPEYATLDLGASEPPVLSLLCNMLWFLSLGLSLACALSATLVEQWARHYLQATRSKPAPQDRARLRAYLFEGLEKYSMATMVDVIPTLLHTSLFLFFAGLIAFLTPINTILARLSTAMLVLCCVLYILVTINPVFDLSSPYFTPLSSLIWFLGRKLQVLHRHDVDGTKAPVLARMSEARELEATDTTSQRDQRDIQATCWTISALRKPREIESFIEVIPSVVSGLDYSAKWLMDALMHHEDINVNLSSRLPRLLATCADRLIDPRVAERRAITCLKSIWSLTMLSIPKPSAQHTSQRQNLKFKEDAFSLFRAVQIALPSLQNYVLSASVVVARDLMDMQVDRAIALEEQLMGIQEPEQPTVISSEETLRYVLSSDRSKIQSDYKIILERMSARVSQQKIWTTAHPHVLVETAFVYQSRLASLARISAVSRDESFVSEVLQLNRMFQVALNQAGFNLALQYVADILEHQSLPHEAFNTIRRTFFRINFGMPISGESQERLLNYLEEAVEHTSSWSTRLPQAIIDILLGLTRALTETKLILRAIGTIERYSRYTPSDAARSCLANLEHALPSEIRIYRSIDFLGSHIYADARPDRLSSPRATWNAVRNPPKP